MRAPDQDLATAAFASTILLVSLLPARQLIFTDIRIGSPSPTRRREEIVEVYANRDYEQVHTEEVVEHGRRREEVVQYSWGPDYDKVFVRDVYDYDGW